MICTKIYGHRGCMGTYPENTIMGFRKAIESGVDGLELDVQMTKDGEIVVIHDEQLNRTTDGVGYVKDLFLDQIQSYSAGAKFSHFQNFEESWRLERVPTLKEVLQLLAPYNIELNIEFKTNVVNYEGIEEKVLSIVKEYGQNRKVLYSAFYLPTLLRVKKLDSSANIAWLLDHPIPHPLDYMQSLDLESLHVSRRVALLGAHISQETFRHIKVWTVNDIDEMNLFLALGVEAIITDFPEIALRNRGMRHSFV